MPDNFFRSTLPSDWPAPPRIDTTVPHIARVYDYWLGGKDNFAVDREIGDRVLRVHPETALSVQANRRFLARAVRYLAGDAGIRQFLDVGTGLPSASNTHEVAQSVAPESRVVYVDNDPIVLAHARALLTSSGEGETGYLEADLRDPDDILAGAGQLLDLTKPVGVMLVAVLHSIGDEDDPKAIVGRLLAAMPPGSFLAVSHLGRDVQIGAVSEMASTVNEAMSDEFTFRSRPEVTAFFDGLTLVEPGVVLTHEWRPDSPDDAAKPGVLWSGVARKD